ncbi:hypothetical protein [Anatilimnocola floriformis]|uniref:hypothetical protein n=1 Tax=Anatilimnocola floriformis TaxID=2948575 RepID=UPI0020C46B4A|nr:hypothetical protein [Anatilimnocola floriformis]
MSITGGIHRRIRPIRDWLGLQQPRVHMTGTATGLLLIALFLSAGCGGPRPITGGTPGVLRAGGDLLADMQITVHQADGGSFRPLGFAVTGADGSFQLVTNEARGALVLQPGLYHCTLESAGSPARIPPVLTKPETTPLRATWAASDSILLLEVPYRLLP